jgi:hypothetical protein
VKLFRRQATHLVLAGPFNRHVTKARYAHSVREPAINGRFDKVGRKEGKRDRHVDLASAAAFALSDTFSACCRLNNEFVKPTEYFRPKPPWRTNG